MVLYLIPIGIFHTGGALPTVKWPTYYLPGWVVVSLFKCCNALPCDACCTACKSVAPPISADESFMQCVTAYGRIDATEAPLPVKRGEKCRGLASLRELVKETSQASLRQTSRACWQDSARQGLREQCSQFLALSGSLS